MSEGQVGVRLATGAVAALAGLTCLVMPATANAGGSTKLARPSGERVIRVSSSSFTVAAKTAANARRYRLFASTTFGDLAESKISLAHRSAPSARPEMSLSGLPYTTQPYFYRVEVMNGTHHRFSDVIHRVGLRPAAPTRLHAARRASGSYLTWNGQASTGFSVTRATNPAMTRGVRRYTVLGTTHQFTPPGLVRGRKYYFQVRSLNDATRSAASAPLAIVNKSSQQALRVMTYNILELTADGTHEGTGIVAPWSERKVAVARLIKRANPDVVAIQEGWPWVGQPRKLREVDSLRIALGGEYGLAHTEVTPSQPHYMRTGDYILYKKSVYKAIGHAWHWSIGNKKFAAYQILENRKTHAKFLFVSVHLFVGNGAAADLTRENETRTMVKDATAFGASHHVPVIYGGDFNTDVNAHHAFDGPGIAMRAAHIQDAFNAAQTRRLASYNSANGDNRRPPRFGDHIDYVFAPPGVSVRSWRLVMDLSHGDLVGVIPSDHNPVVVNLDFPY